MVSDSVKLKKVFNERFSGLIWRLQIQEQKGYLAIESRVLESKKVFFSVLNLLTGEIYVKEKSFTESMNPNLVYLGKESLLIKLHEHLESPESKGLISVNFKNANVLWEKYNYAIQQVTNYGIQVFDSKIYPRKYLWIDHLSAEVLPNPENLANDSSTLILPELIEDYQFHEFIEHGLIVGSVFKLDFNDLHIVCFHEKTEDKIQQRILIYQNDKKLHEDILISDIQKLQPESFFILNKQLFYIRNKNEIVSYFV